MTARQAVLSRKSQNEPEIVKGRALRSGPKHELTVFRSHILVGRRQWVGWHVLRTVCIMEIKGYFQ